MSIRGQCLQHAPPLQYWHFDTAHFEQCVPRLIRTEFTRTITKRRRHGNNRFNILNHDRSFTCITRLQQTVPSETSRQRLTRSAGWSNAYAENVTLKSKPESNVRSRLREWQLNQGQLKSQTEDFALPIGDLTGDYFVRPEVPRFFQDDHSTLHDYFHFEDHPDEDIYKAQFSPGDMVELITNGHSSILAVLVGILGVQYQFYTIHGKIIHIQTTKRFIFTYPGFIEAEKLEYLKPFLPAEEVLDEFMNVFTDVDATVPRTATSPILKRMTRFQEKVDEIYRRHSAKLDNAHAIVAHSTRLTHLSCQELARKLLEPHLLEVESTLWPALYAITRFVLKRIPGFSVELRMYNQSNRVIVDSLTTVARFERVVSWVRAFQEEMALSAVHASIPEETLAEALPLKMFVNKAKDLIILSRLRRTLIPGCGIGTSDSTYQSVNDQPSDLPESIKSFSSSDRDIIHFLLLGRLTGYLSHGGTLRSLQSTIVRATRAYANATIKDTDDSQDIWNLLIEIGAVQPWQNPYDPSREILSAPASVRSELRNFNENVKNGKSIETAAGFQDLFENARHDLGDLPVYCIDAKGTVDVDDGISVEAIPGYPDECWLHVHVSHPSAFFERGSFPGRHAMYEVTNTYLPDSRRTLLPALMANYFSIASGGPVLTYSARLNKDGIILESKIRPSIVHNVRYLELDTVRTILTGNPEHARAKTYSVGHGSENVKAEEPLMQEYTTRERESLAFLFEFCLAFEKRRTQGRVNEPSLQQPTVKLQSSRNESAVTAVAKNYSAADFSAEIPTILLTVPSSDLEYPASRFENLLVSESMLIAGTVAAMFCRDRNIPIIYHGTRKAYYSVSENVVRNTLSAVKKLGIPGKSIAVMNQFYVRKNVATMPIEHKGLGLEVYTKVTSPMRRGVDLMVSWQIDAALKEEAKEGQLSVSSRDEPSLPFTKDDLDICLPWIQWKLEHAVRFQSCQIKHWMTQFMFRAHYFKEFPLPDPLLMTAMLPRPHGTYDGPFHELGLYCTLSRDASEYIGEAPMPEFQRGDIWQVAIVRISTFFRRVDVRPVRLLSKSAAAV